MFEGEKYEAEAFRGVTNIVERSRTSPAHKTCKHIFHWCLKLYLGVENFGIEQPHKAAVLWPQLLSQSQLQQLLWLSLPHHLRPHQDIITVQPWGILPQRVHQPAKQLPPVVLQIPVSLSWHNMTLTTKQPSLFTILLPRNPFLLMKWAMTF